MKRPKTLRARGLQAVSLVVCCILGASNPLTVHWAEAVPLPAMPEIRQLGPSATGKALPKTALVHVKAEGRDIEAVAQGPRPDGVEYYLEFRPEDPADTLHTETGSETASDSLEYYLEFESEEPSRTSDTEELIQTEPDTTEYYIDFESMDLPDTLEAEPDVMEIEIDDDGVRVEKARHKHRLEINVGVWDDPENHIYECEKFDGDRGRLDWGLGLSYQRVDGLSWILKQNLLHSDWRVPRIRLREIYSSKQSKWFYDAGIEQMISLPLPIYLGASVYKITDSNPIDREIIESSENSIAAFFLREDYRDYFTREGTSLHARLEIPAAGALEVKYLDDRYGSLEKKTDWSLFKGSEHFRMNPLIDEGEMNSYMVSYTLDKRSDVRCLTKGPWVRLLMERAGYGLGGDFEFTTLFLDARNYLKLSPSQFLRYRLMAGSRTDGCLPLQKEFYVGGIGTLRGHDYKELTGDQMILGNIEYGAYAGKNVGMFVFVDSGKAWYGDGEFLDQRLELDAGVGIELLCQQTHIYAAKDLKNSDSPILVGVRLSRTF